MEIQSNRFDIRFHKKIAIRGHLVSRVIVSITYKCSHASSAHLFSPTPRVIENVGRCVAQRIAPRILIHTIFNHTRVDSSSSSWNRRSINKFIDSSKKRSSPPCFDLIGEYFDSRPNSILLYSSSIFVIERERKIKRYIQKSI